MRSGAWLYANGCFWPEAEVSSPGKYQSPPHQRTTSVNTIVGGLLTPAQTSMSTSARTQRCEWRRVDGLPAHKENDRFPYADA